MLILGMPIMRKWINLVVLSLLATLPAACASQTSAPGFISPQQSEPAIVKSYATSRYAAVQLAGLPDGVDAAADQQADQ
jgi:hypothetical protein